MLTFAAFLSNIPGLCVRNNVRVHCNSLTGRSMGPMADISRLGALSRLRLNTMVDEWIWLFTSCRTSIHATLCTQQCASTLQQSNRPLHGPDGRCLEVRGSFKATLKYHGRRVDIAIYVLPNTLAQPASQFSTWHSCSPRRRIRC